MSQDCQPLLRYSNKVTCCCRAASFVRYLAICKWCALSCALHHHRANHGGAPSKFASMAGCMMIPPTTTRLGTSPGAPAVSRRWLPPPGRWPPPTPRPLPAAPHAEPARTPAHSVVKMKSALVESGVYFLHAPYKALTKLVRPHFCQCLWKIHIYPPCSPASLKQPTCLPT